MKPYIGITDFETLEQVNRMRELFVQLVENKNPRDLMVGVMMSYKTLKGFETKWAKAWPAKEKVGEIFIKNSHILNTLHYADYDAFTTADDLFASLVFADSKNGLDAVQLDMPWPNPQMVSQAMDVFCTTRNKRIPVILQVGGVAIRACDSSRKNVISNVSHYRDMVDCIHLT